MSPVVQLIKQIAPSFDFLSPKTTPQFPHFKKLHYTDKETYEKLTNRYNAYSDFNFTSAYTWNVDGSHQYSLHNRNLILKLADYNDGSPVLTVLGKHNVDETLKRAIVYSKDTFGNPALKLVPETTIQAIKDRGQFEIFEDEDNYDHIFDLCELANLKGNRFKSKRQAANRCDTKHDITFAELEETSSDIVREIETFLRRWSNEKQEKTAESTESAAELKALLNVFKHFNHDPRLLLTMAYIENELVGFSIDELLENQHVISHYFKTVPSVSGLSEHFNRMVAASLLARGYKYWNWEQDLGLESLRKMKLAYRPVSHHKKYVVKMRCE